MDFWQFFIQNLPELTAQTVGTVIIPMYIGNNISKRITLSSKKTPKNISKLSFPPEIKQKVNKVNITNEEILEFVKRLEENLPEKSLKNLKNNLSSLKVKNNKVISFIGMEGCYLVFNNSIYLSNKTAIYHELFHMASTTKGYNGMQYSGFHQGKFFSMSVGKGLNEGYTETLTRRYFKDKNMSEPYDIEVDIARKIEKIVGKDKMTELYLEGNLLGLIEELKQYASEEEIMNFIANVDVINAFEIRDFIFKNKTIQRSIKNMINFLLKAHMRYLRNQLEEGLITEKECYEMHGEYVESFSKMLHFSIHKYKGLENIDLYKAYDELNNEIKR